MELFPDPIGLYRNHKTNLFSLLESNNLCSQPSSVFSLFQIPSMNKSQLKDSRRLKSYSDRQSHMQLYLLANPTTARLCSLAHGTFRMPHMHLVCSYWPLPRLAATWGRLSCTNRRSGHFVDQHSMSVRRSEASIPLSRK